VQNITPVVKYGNWHGHGVTDKTTEAAQVTSRFFTQLDKK
jgi:hypothetical protein